MGGALEGGWMEGGSLGAEEEGDGEKTRLVGENGRGSSADPFQWEEGSTGSRDSSVFQVIHHFKLENACEETLLSITPLLKLV